MIEKQIVFVDVLVAIMCEDPEEQKLIRQVNLMKERWIG